MADQREKAFSSRSVILIAVVAAAVGAMGTGWAVLGRDSYASMVMDHDRMHAEHMASGEADHMMGGMGHGGGMMPGLMGRDASPEESAEIAAMFAAFETITREVDNLDDGIRTVTRSSDPEVMAILVSHVVGMIDRVETGRDPEIIVQSPTLDIFFERSDAIETTIDVTDDGIVVVQTSTDPDVVAALHTHAGEVSAMADRGMDALHDMMAARGSETTDAIPAQ